MRDYQLSASEIASLQQFAERGTYRPNEDRMMWAYQNPTWRFVADQLCPWAAVNDTQGQYTKVDAAAFFGIADMEMDKDGYLNQTNWGDSQVNYDLVPHGHAVFVADVDKKRAVNKYGSEAKFRMVNNQFLAHKMRLHREQLVLSLLTTSGNYDSTLTLDGTAGKYYWDDANNSDPRARVLDAKKEIAKWGMNANYVVVNPDTHYALLKHPAIKATISGGATKKSANEQAVVDEEVIRNYFQIDNYVVAWTAYNSTPQTTQTQSWLMTDSCAVLYVDPTAGGNELIPTFAKTLVFTPEANLANGGWQTKEVRDERAGGSGGTYYNAWYYSEEKIISSRAGYLIINTIA